MFFALSVPADNARGPQYMEQALAAVHQANHGRLPLTLAFGSRGQTVSLFCRVPSRLEQGFLAQLGAYYPDCEIKPLPDHDPAAAPHTSAWSAELHLRPDLFPIWRYAHFEDTLNRNSSDPLTGIFAALATNKRSPFPSRIEITAWPAAGRRVRLARRAARVLACPFLSTHPRIARLYARLATAHSPFLRLFAFLLASLLRRGEVPLAPTPPVTRTHDREDDVQAVADKTSRHLFDVRIRLLVVAPRTEGTRARAQIHRLAGALGQFTLPRRAAFSLSRLRFHPAPPRIRRRHGFLMSCEELATLWHPATATVRAPAMQITASRELEPPVSLPTSRDGPEIALLGRIRFRSRREAFGIRRDDRLRHLSIIGKTGMGKTTLLQKLIASDIAAGRELALIDPHGDLAEALLNCIPSSRTNDVILFDAGDRDFPLSFNPLACRDPHQRPLVASGIVSAFKKLYGDSWGPRLEHILRNALLALLEVPGTSLLSLQSLLGDTAYRKGITGRTGDPVVRTFWDNEFASWKPQYRAEAIAPIQNKVGQFLSHPILRSILGQSRSSLDLRRVMDEGHVLIVNLSKGRIGEDGSMLLGSLLVTGLQLAAMSRADVPESQRRDFFLYVDEFQNFATDSFATILSEARKYRLGIILANQYLAQMDETTAAALFGNVGSLLCFQVGASDAEVLAEQLGGDLKPQDLLALPKYRAYLRLLIDGHPSRPFSMETLLPPRPPHLSRAEVVRRTSRHRYTRKADLVEREIRHVFASAT